MLPKEEPQPHTDEGIRPQPQRASGIAQLDPAADAGGIDIDGVDPDAPVDVPLDSPQ